MDIWDSITLVIAIMTFVTALGITLDENFIPTKSSYVLWMISASIWMVISVGH